MQRPVASFTLTREHRHIAGQVTPRSANLINACKSSQHLLPVSKTHKPRCLQHLLEDGSDPQQQLAVGVCCVCKATFFPQPPPPALRESKHKPRRKLTPGAKHTRPVSWAEPLLLPETAPLVHQTAGEPRGRCGEFLTMLQRCSI